MNPGRYFIPNMGMGPMMRTGPGFAMNSMIGTNGFAMRNSLFSRLTNGIKNFNWNGLINGANKTLNVVNQTIPLIRQTKPMVNNVKNMVSLARAFRKETNKNVKNNYVSSINNSNKENVIIKKEVMNNNNPNFFI